MKHIKTIKCDINVRMLIKKPYLLDAVDSRMCKICKSKKRLCILKYQSNIASKQDTGMERYTISKNKHLMSFKDVELGSVAHPQDILNAEITGYAF